MVAIVSGNGLGLFNSSLNLLGGYGPGGQSTLGRLGEHLYLNAATGNLVIQNQDEYLANSGLDLALIRTYNSQGLFNDDNGDNWRLGVYRALSGLTGTVNTVGSTITKTNSDGATSLYTYDSVLGVYRSQDGDGAHDTLKFDAVTNQWTWTDGSLRNTETYNSTGQLIASRDVDGNLTTYAYTGALLTQITDASGQSTYLDYTGNNLTQIRVVSQGQTQTLTRYYYDTRNRLTQVVVDLSPADNSVPLQDANGDGAYDSVNGQSYVTRYTYDGTSTRIASITQGDDTSISFTYEQAGTQYRVKTYTDGEGRTTGFTYDTVNRVTDVTDPLGQVTSYVSDAQGRLTQALSPTVNGTRLTTSYAYDTQNNVAQVTDARGHATVMQYDTQGNLTLTRDALGNTVMRTYSSTNQLLTETLYLIPDPDGAGAGQPANPLTTRYAYDSENHLRFSISAEGRVTEQRYNAEGNRSATIGYTAGVYNLTGLAPTAALSEAQLTTWAAAQDKTKTERVDYSYDFRGQISTATTYAAVNASGQGIADGTHAVTRFIYDQRGQLLQTLDARSGDTPDANNPNRAYATTYTYDGLGRVLTTVQWVSAGVTRSTVNDYDDLNRRTTVTLVNGLATTRFFDRSGRLLSISQADTSQALGTTIYQYDADGRLRITTDPTGVKTHVLYDEAGRQVAVIDGAGALTETVYDLTGNIIKQIRYATSLTSAQLASLSLTDAQGRIVDIRLAAVRPVANLNPINGDRLNWNLYDAANRLVMVIETSDDSATQGYVTKSEYDGAGRITDVVRYTTLITLPAAPTAANVTLLLQNNALSDRLSRSFYDNDGKPLATLDAEGYLTEYRYDTGGRLSDTLRYATAANSSLRATGALAQLKTGVGTTPDDQRSYTFYNAKGQITATLDAEGYFTEYVYDAAGNQTQQTRYYNKGAAYTGAQTITQLRPQAHANDQVVMTAYNGANQATQVTTNPAGTLTRYTYDNVGNLIQTDKAWNTAEVRTNQVRYDAQGHVLQELSGEGSVALEALSSATATANNSILSTTETQTYNLNASALTPDEIANPAPAIPSVYQSAYYDNDGRIVGIVDQGGTLISYVYDSQGHLIRERHHAQAGAAPRWSQSFSADAAGLTPLSANHMSVQGGRLVVAAQEGTDGQYATVWGERLHAFNDGVIFRSEVTTGPSAAGRYLAIGAESTFDINLGEYRQHAAYFDTDGNVFVSFFDGDWQGAWLGSVHDNTTYVVEVVTGATNGTTLYVYEKGGDRANGFIDHRAFSDWGVAQTLIESYGEAGAPGVMYVDNVSEATVAGALIGSLIAPENAADPVTDYVYDPAGRVIATVTPGNVVTTYQYDAVGNITSRRTYTEPAATPRWYQDFSTDSPTGLPAGYMSVQDGRLVATTRDSATTEWVGIWGKQQHAFSDGVIFRSEMTTGPSADGRYLIIGAESTWDTSVGVYRRHTAYLDNGDLYVSFYDVDWQSQLLGTVQNDTTYVVEVVTHAGGTTLYVYEKGQDRTSGFIDQRSFTDWGVAQSFIETFGEPGRASATMYVDNMTEATAQGELLGRWVVRPSANDVIMNSGGTPYYAIQNGDTWSQIALVLYGSANVADELQSALGDPVLTAGNRLTNLPATLTDATPITVPSYYTVQTGDTWEGITLAVYGASNVNAVQALRNQFPNVTLTPGLHLTVPQTLVYDTGIPVPPAQIDAIWNQWSLTHAYAAAGRRTSTTDQNGNRTLFYYDAAGRLRFTVNALGEVTETRYNTFGQVADTYRYTNRLSTAGLSGGLLTPLLLTQLTPAVSANDHHRGVNYTLRGAVREAIDALGAGTRYTYNRFGELFVLDQPIDATTRTPTSYLYDKRGLLTQTTKDNGGLNRITSRSYDAFGRITSTTNGNGSLRRYTYDRLGREVTTTLDPTGLNLTTSASYDALSRVLTQRDARGNTTTYSYDDASRAFTIITPEGIRTLTRGNRHGETVELEVQEANGTRVHLARYRYDKNGNLTEATQAAESLNLSATYTYDRADRKILTRDANGVYTRLDYDAANRLLTRSVDPQTINTANDNPNGLNLTTRYTYDGQGRVLTVTEGADTPDARTTQTFYDAKGQVTEMIVDPSGLNIRTTYGYDARGKTLRVTEGAGRPEARTTEYRYDNLGRRTLEIKDPTGFNLRCVYVYDQNDNLIKKTEAPGTPDEQVRRYVYDAANRLIFKIDALGFATESAYDANSNVIATLQYGTPLLSNILAQVDANSSQALTTVRTNLVTANSEERGALYLYDQDNRQRYTVDALGHLQERRYNAAGQVTDTIAYANALNSAAILLSVGYTLAQIAALTPDQIRALLPTVLNTATLAAGLIPSVTQDQRTRYVYDAAGRMTACTHAQGTAVEYTETYAYDSVGNAIRHTNGRGHHEYFAYDAANRQTRHIDYLGYVVDTSYDNVGNRKTQTTHMNAVAPPAVADDRFAYNAPNPSPNTDPTAGDRVTRYAYDQAGRLETETAPAINGAPGVITRYVYDALGNMTDKTEAAGLPEARITHSVYDKLNRLSEQTIAYGAPEAATSRFAYDLAGNQMRYIDPRGVELAERDTPWAVAERQRLGYPTSAAALTAGERDTLLALYTTTQVFDQLNRKTSVTDAMGGTTATQYDAFGNIVKVTDPKGNIGYFYTDALNRVSFQVDPEGYATETQYGAFGNTKETIHYANKVQGTYNENTKPVILASAPGGTPPAAYLITDTARDQHTLGQYDALNRTTQITDAEGYVETFSYDAQGNVITHRDKNNNLFSYDYDAGGNKIAERLPVTSANSSGQQVPVVNRYEYDAVGNKTRYIEAQGLPEERITQYVYDKNDRKIETIEPQVLVGVQSPSVGGSLTVGGGPANFVFSQNYTEAVIGGILGRVPVDITSSLDISWPSIIGYRDGNIKIVWDTGNSNFGTLVSVVASGATSAHIQAATGQSALQGDFILRSTYLVQVFKETSAGDVLVAAVNGSYSWSDSTTLRGTSTTSTNVKDVIHFTGQPTDGRTLRVAYWPSSDPNNITELDLASYAPGTFTELATGVLSGNYSYEAKVFDTQGQVLNHLTGTFSVVNGTGSTTTQGVSLLTGQLQTPHTFKTYDPRGNVITETDAKGNTAYHYYDANNRFIGTVDAERYLHRYFYDAADNLIAERIYADRIPEGVALTTLPDPAVIAGMDGINYRETSYRYNANNLRVEARIQDVLVYDLTSGLRPQATLVATEQYDANGNRVLATDANGNKTFYFYDKAGHRIAQVDPLGYVSFWEVDGNGNIVQETRYATALSAAVLAALTPEANPAGLRPAASPDDRITIYHYDRMDRKIEEALQNLAVSTVSATNGGLSTQTGAAVTRYTYDGMGNLSGLTAPDQGLTNYLYDGMNRLTQDLGPSVTDFQGSSIRSQTVITYDGVGHIKSITRKSTTTTENQITRYEYDLYGNRTKEIDPLNGPITYFYDLNGNITVKRERRTNPDGTQPAIDTLYTYDRLNRQATTQDAKNFVYSAKYNAYDEIVAKGLNGLDQEYYEYDRAGRLIKTNKDDGANKAYLYDANGNETTKIQSAIQDTDLKPLTINDIANLRYLPTQPGAGPLVNRTESEYDARNQLTQTHQAPIEFTSDSVAIQHVWVDAMNNPFAGGSLTGMKGGPANLVFSQDYTPASVGGVLGLVATNITSSLDISWPSIVGYDNGNIRIVWNTGNSTFGSLVSVVGSSATSAHIQAATGQSALDGNYLLNSSYSVQIFKETSSGDVLIAVVSGNYSWSDSAFPLRGTSTTSANVRDVIHFTGQRTEAQTLELQLRPAGSTGPWAVYSVPKLTTTAGTAIDGHFVFDWTAISAGNYDYEFRTRDNAGTELDYVKGTLTLGANPTVNSKLIDTVQPVLTPGSTVTSTIVRAQTNNAFGEVVAEIDGRGHALTISDEAWAQAERQRLGFVALVANLTATDKDALRRIYTTSLHYNTRGQLVEKQDPETSSTLDNGSIVRLRPTTQYSYDAVGNSVGMRDANQNLFTQRYDAAGNLVAEYHPDGGSKQYGYDLFGNKRFVLNEINERTDYTYDAKNQLIRLDHPTGAAFLDGNGNPNAPRYELYAYDEMGRRIRHSNALGFQELTYYDDIGRVKKTVSYGGISTGYRYIYDAASGGATTITTQGDGRTLRDTHDFFKRLLSHQDLGSHSFNYTYNKAGWLIRQTGDTNLTTPGFEQNIDFTYYHNGYLKETIDSGVNTRSQYAYDANGNRIFEGYYQGGNSSVYYQWSKAQYDELNRVIAISDPKYNVSYEYDANGNRRHIYARYHDGLNSGIQRQDYWYAYDMMNRFLVTKGRFTATTTDANGEPLWNRGNGAIEAGTNGYAITYNAASERASATYQGPSGISLRETYVYAADGLLERVETDPNIGDDAMNPDPTPAYVSARRYYDAVGNVKQYLELNSSGGVTRNYQYSYTGDSRIRTENDGQFTSTYNYDLAGNLTSVVSPQSGGTTLTTSYSYEYWDSAKQQEIRLQASNQQAPGWAPGFSRFTYDVNGHLTKVSDEVANRHLSYKLDADGRILQRNELIGSTSSRTQYYYYLNGIGIGDAGGFSPSSSRMDYAELLATRGQNPDRSGKPISSADFDYNFQPINDQYPATTPGSYTVRQGDTLQSVALAVWGDASLWYLIADANGLSDSTVLIAGQTLVIPNVVANIHNNSSTFRVYNPGELIGDTMPTLPDPPPPPQPDDDRCFRTIATIIVIVVTIIVAIYATEALVEWGEVAAAILGAAAGNAAGQAVAMALGLQDKFNWKAVAAAALTAGIMKGVVGSTSGVVTDAMTQNVVGQGVNILLGQQQKFSWSSLAVSAITAPINEEIDEKFGSTDNNLQNGGYADLSGQQGRPFTLENFGNSLVGEFLKGVTRQAATILVNRGGKIDWNNVATQALGNAIGNSIVGQMKYSAAKDQKVKAEVDRMMQASADRVARNLSIGATDNTGGVNRDSATDTNSTSTDGYRNFTRDPVTGQYVDQNGRTAPTMYASAGGLEIPDEDLTIGKGITPDGKRIVYIGPRTTDLSDRTDTQNTVAQQPNQADSLLRTKAEEYFSTNPPVVNGGASDQDPLDLLDLGHAQTMFRGRAANLVRDRLGLSGDDEIPASKILNPNRGEESIGAVDPTADRVNQQFRLVGRVDLVNSPFGRSYGGYGNSLLDSNWGTGREGQPTDSGLESPQGRGAGAFGVTQFGFDMISGGLKGLSETSGDKNLATRYDIYEDRITGERKVFVQPFMRKIETKQWGPIPVDRNAAYRSLNSSTWDLW